jgi:hypothetical protein
MATDTEWFDNLWTLREQTPEQRLEQRYHELVTDLLADYEPSYSAGAAENEWRMAPGGENDPYSGPFYTTAAEADEAAAIALERADAATALLPAAEDALREQTQYVEKLRAELDGCRPWQRHRREQLRERISEAVDVQEGQNGDVWVLEWQLESSLDHHTAAVWIGGVLRRYERAVHAAQEAAARTMGWRPGQPVPASGLDQPRPLGSGRAVTASGDRVLGSRPRAAIGDPGRSAAATPLIQPPPQQTPGGPTACM